MDIKEQGVVVLTSELNQGEIAEQFEAGLKQTASGWREIKARIRAANPAATKEQIDLLYVQERYGEETAQQFAAGIQ